MFTDFQKQLIYLQNKKDIPHNFANLIKQKNTKLDQHIHLTSPPTNKKKSDYLFNPKKKKKQQTKHEIYLKKKQKTKFLDHKILLKEKKQQTRDVNTV